ncbi:hypothetical protein RAS12_30715 (plasmid) [Achromobacter seleniivolatilans]|uniref:IrrE N-terminal-like domain-containing protein n=1 Tax=Achromobacter seleniivolatilans TaxID=3047478 RepID=A0ABY9MAF7_9BURK|nr:hypothetical protein [Achromobacter sp. R39]WMD24007.1 hypothetical protein RAS12_30715 [Achromobacter sp. R39]
MTLIAKRIPNGYSWTLVTRLGDMLAKAEHAYGRRDQSYTLLGIEFREEDPQIWYPGNCGHIAIQITTDVINDMPMACYQLAHECVHLLSPTGERVVNAFEEGLATYFAHKYVQEEFGRYVPDSYASYAAAKNLVAELLALDSDAVKVLRRVEPTISKITAEQITVAYPSLNPATAAALAAPFEREAGGIQLAHAQ